MASPKAALRAPSSKVPSFTSFDWETYVNANPDLQAAGINTAEAAYNHYINHGYAENRPGAPGDGAFELDEALEQLANARADLEAFYDEARSNDALVDNQGITETSTDAQVEAAIAAEYTYSSNDLETSTGLSNFETRSSAAQNAAITDTRDALVKVINDLNKDISDVPGLAAAIKRYNAAVKAEADADDALDDVGDRAAADLAAFDVLNGAAGFTADDGAGAVDLSASPSDIVNVLEITDGTTTVIEMNAAGTKFVLSTGITEASYPGVTTLLNALNANLQAFKAWEQADADLNDPTTGADAYLTTFDAAVFADTELGGYGTADAVALAVLNAQDDLQGFDKEVARFRVAEELANELENLHDALTDAAEVFEDLGYEAPVFVDGAEVATADADVFVFDGDSGSIAGFDSDDILYFSKDYNYKLLSGSDDLNGNADFGDVAQLDIFVKQVGANTVIYVEKNSYDGQADGPWNGETITLVGVDASSLTFENGYLRLADAVA